MGYFKISDKNISGRQKGVFQPNIHYPPELPITAKKEEIVDAIRNNQVIIVTGETGSGKSTQIPKMCIEAGRGVSGMIGCTQPRRVAAVSIAHRIAEELRESIGQSVSYKIRFEEVKAANPLVRVMTDGILLMEIQSDPELRMYDTIIVDEAHERSVNIDFILGILRNLIKKREDLKVIITSATLETEKFVKAFENPPIIEVSGRLYPVSVEYRPIDPIREEEGEFTYIDATLEAVRELEENEPYGDILVFMPTEQDIRETCERLLSIVRTKTVVLPLYSRLPWSDQKRVFHPVTGRKVIVSTNVAETSITIPNIRFVIDTGFARISQYNPRSKTTSLPIRPISRSSADQRMGRCGRVMNGVCIRLYSETDYLERPRFTTPEILRSNLSGVVLRMLYLKLGNIEEFPFIDPPQKKNITDAFEQLQELGAIHRDKDGSWKLTELGNIMAKLPLDPHLSRILLEGIRRGCRREIQVIVSGLTIIDPRERPLGLEKKADEKHALYSDSRSDFMTLLKIWNEFHNTWDRLQTQNQLRKFCKENYLSFRRMREWRDVYEQINRILDEHAEALFDKLKPLPKQEDIYEAVHKAILSGYLSHVAEQEEGNLYKGTKGKKILIHPGSGLYKRGGKWIVAAELVQTNRLFARLVAKVEPSWIEEMGKHLCTLSYSSPRFDSHRGEVVVDVKVSLWGLVIVPRRTVSYKHVNPDEATDIFIREGLMTGEIKTHFRFLSHNLQIVEKIKKIENKLRRWNILDEETIFQFYKNNLVGVSDVRSLKKIIKERGGDSFLFLKENDIINEAFNESVVQSFPDELSLNGHSLPIEYRFAPGSPEDGVTLKVPLELLAKIKESTLERAVPGLLEQKITMLLKQLPREYRRKLPSISEICTLALKSILQSEEPLVNALSSFLQANYGIHIPAEAWLNEKLPDFLRLRIEVVGNDNVTHACSRDLSLLKETVVEDMVQAAFEKEKSRWEKEDLSTWDFGDLPERVPLLKNNVEIGYAYPALECKDGKVNLRIFRDMDNALSNHLRGVRCLYEKFYAKHTKHLRRSISISPKLKNLSLSLGGNRAIEQSIYNRVMNDLFAKNIRSKKEFDEHGERVRPLILQRGQEIVKAAELLLDTYHDTEKTIKQIEARETKNPAALSFTASVRQELKKLMPPNFIEIYPDDRFSDLSRYMRALAIKAERGIRDLRKALLKEKEIQYFEERYTELKKSSEVSQNTALAGAVEEFRWMIEEYKISLFAQELKTAFPISRKRLEEKLEEINSLKKSAI
ncbi:MAG: ATP-dependent RNA helicase HrpA [Syntrophales bacterium]|nr:ATP-dependent RNA helicase HrpA [Syntrophales bacterium]